MGDQDDMTPDLISSGKTASFWMAADASNANPRGGLVVAAAVMVGSGSCRD